MQGLESMLNDIEQGIKKVFGSESFYEKSEIQLSQDISTLRWLVKQTEKQFFGRLHPDIVNICRASGKFSMSLSGYLEELSNKFDDLKGNEELVNFYRSINHNLRNGFPRHRICQPYEEFVEQAAAKSSDFPIFVKINEGEEHIPRIAYDFVKEQALGIADMPHLREALRDIKDTYVFIEKGLPLLQYMAANKQEVLNLAKNDLSTWEFRYMLQEPIKTV